jgi:hypothetical protein
MLCLQASKILLKGMPDCRLAFSQGIHMIQSNSLGRLCTVEVRPHQDDNPRLTRKFNKWEADNFNLTSSLVLAVMHPISRIRLGSHVAVIRLKELPNGFRVLSVEAVSIESLPDKHKYGEVLNYQTNQPELVYCVALFHVEAIDVSSSCIFPIGYRFGTYLNLAAFQVAASLNNGRQDELIKMLNKEI